MSETNKRKSSSDEQQAQHSKKAKPTENSDEHVDAPKETIVFGLSVEMWKEIFKYLNSIDLVSICRTDEQFQAIAKSVFKEKFDNPKFYNWDERIRSQSITELNCFGSVITKLDVAFNLGHFKDLYDAIINNCSDNITEVTFLCSGVNGCDWIDLRKIDVQAAWAFIKQLKTQFPKLQRLSIDCDCYGHPMCPLKDDFVAAMPSLKHFGILEDSYLHLENLKSFIELNPQLESLSLPLYSLPGDFVSFLDANLPNLKSLEFFDDSLSDDSLGAQFVMPTQTDYLKNLQKLSFDLFSFEGVRKYGFSGESLRYLECRVNADNLDRNEKDFIDSISYMSQLETIKLALYSFTFQPAQREFSLTGGIKYMVSRLDQLSTIIVQYQQMNGVELDSLRVITTCSFDGAQWGVNLNERERIITFNKIV